MKDRLNRNIDDYEFPMSSLLQDQKKDDDIFRSGFELWDMINDIGDYQQDTVETPDIKDVPSIEDTMTNQVIQKIDEKNKKNLTATEAKKKIKEAPKKEKFFAHKKKQQALIDNEELAKDLEKATGLEVPENTNVPMAIESYEAAADLKIDDKDLEIKLEKEKNEVGLNNAAIVVKPHSLPENIHALSSKVISLSKKKVMPRLTDLRVVVHTNEVQLRNSSIKLTGKCITFKPPQSAIKTNKGTRVIVSQPLQGNSWYIYLSAGRDHRIYEIPEAQKRLEWTARRIIEFFESGMEVAASKIHLREIESPMMELTDEVLKTGKYLAKPILDKTNKNQINSVIFVKKNTKNSWLTISLINDFPNYRVEGFSKSHRIEESVYFDVYLTKDTKKTSYTYNEIKQRLVDVMDECFDKSQDDWFKAMGLNGESPELLRSKLGIMKGKLTFRPLKIAMENIMDMITDPEENKSDIKIKDVLDKNQIEKISENAFKRSKSNGEIVGESIIGSTKKCDFVLTYMLLFLKERDKRLSSEFITSDKYYYNKQLQKKSFDRAVYYTGVRDHRPAELREKSLAGKGKDRYYNSGDYVFMLEYRSKVTKKKSVYISKTFDDIKNTTHFLEEKPKYDVKSEYDKYL